MAEGDDTRVEELSSGQRDLDWRHEQAFAEIVDKRLLQRQIVAACVAATLRWRWVISRVTGAVLCHAGVPAILRVHWDLRVFFRPTPACVRGMSPVGSGDEGTGHVLQVEGLSESSDGWA